ncbi:lysophospholipid acyltransferase family protein [Rhodococcus sp. NPDC003318]|uniref:lysophospholipid acyltransferase family protein n=1 Tax=Rhodococcus sp. NPDC003318 TaxID=3364503 RepID=UPI0036A513AA
MTHAWMPSSPCGDGCHSDPERRAGAALVAFRYASVVTTVVAAAVLPAAALLPSRWRRGVHRRHARIALRALGVRLQVRDERGPSEPGRGVLAVAGHVSWLDILVLNAVESGDYVARADLLDWPLLGSLARRARVVPIDRGRLRELPGVVDEAAERLRTGARVVAFPEGTTWCGRAFGRLRPALFQAAVDSGAVVEPVELRYLRADGTAETGVCFVGDQTLVASLRRTVRLRGVLAEVRRGPLQEPGADRRELAARCERLVHGGRSRAREADVLLGAARTRREPVA